MTQVPDPEFFFLRRDIGQRLCVHHAPAAGTAPIRAAVVFVHAFAEEMNKSRRMVSLQSRALAAAGCAVFQIDLLGCGDSSGLLSDADWSSWVADAQAGVDWLVSRYPDVPLWLWGHRAGALLAAEVAAKRQPPTHLLLWQPVVSGKTQVQQFLRLKAAASIGAGGNASAAMAEMRQTLMDGKPVEVAGYPMTGALVNGLESALLQQPGDGSIVHWLELSTRPDPSISPASEKTLSTWRSAGLNVQATVVAGPAFWQTTEIEEAPALLRATVDHVLGRALAA